MNQTAPLPAHLVELTYAPMDWATHPIDTAPEQPQGWGPLSGPWMPVQYVDPASMIDFYWTQTDNVNTLVGPGYDDITLYDDPSLDSVNNSSYAVKALDAAETAAHQATSTIANVVNGNQGFGRIIHALGMGGDT